MDIYFTPLARERLDDIVEYLDITWGKVIKKELSFRDNSLSEVNKYNS